MSESTALDELSPPANLVEKLHEWIGFDDWRNLLTTLEPEPLRRLCVIALTEPFPLARINHNFWNAVIVYHTKGAHLAMHDRDYFLRSLENSKTIVRNLKAYADNPDAFEAAWDSTLEVAKADELFREAYYYGGMHNVWGQEIAGKSEDPECLAAVDALKVQMLNNLFKA